MYFVISLFYVSFSSSFSGSFDILFYDGFKKTVQGINIKTMPKDVQQQVSTVNKGVSQPEGSEVKGSNVLGFIRKVTKYVLFLLQTSIQSINPVAMF